MSTGSSKADALARGRANRGTTPPPAPPPKPSAAPLPPPPDSQQTSTGGKAPDGQGRRSKFRKLSLEFLPKDHDKLKSWLLNSFGGSAKATPVIRALLQEAYQDPALTDRVRARLEQSRDSGTAE